MERSDEYIAGFQACQKIQDERDKEILKYFYVYEKVLFIDKSF